MRIRAWLEEALETEEDDEEEDDDEWLTWLLVEDLTDDDWLDLIDEFLINSLVVAGKETTGWELPPGIMRWLWCWIGWLKRPILGLIGLRSNPGNPSSYFE